MIALQSISKAFNGIPAVREITFDVEPGEATALIGPTGSGKTTVLRLIAGLEIPDSGSIAISERIVSKSGWACPPHERGVGMVFQRPALWPHMTVIKNVRFGLGGLKRTEADQRLHETLSLTYLEGLEQRRPHQLSGGEAQRVALARAIAPRPQILLMDEPLIGLDSELHKQMVELIHTIRKQIGTTILYVTHYLSEAESVTDRVVVLHQGRVDRVGSWQDIRGMDLKQ